MDTIREIVTKALKEKVLVVKVEDEYFSNPEISKIEEMFRERLALKFRKIIGPDDADKTYKYTQQIHVRGQSLADYTPIIIRKNGITSVIAIADLYKQYGDSPITDVETWGPSGWEPVLRAFKHEPPYKQLNRVIAYGGILDCTADHSLFRRGDLFSASNVVSPIELEPGDSIATVEELPLLCGTRTVDPEFAWVMGFFLAEGSIRRKRQREASFDQKNREALLRVERWALSHGLKVNWSRDRTRVTVYRLGIWDDFYWISGHVDYHGRGYLKKIPEWVFQWDRTSLWHFLQGYLDGDGLHTKGRETTGGHGFASSSQLLVQGIILIMNTVFSKPKFTLEATHIHRVYPIDGETWARERGKIKAIIPAYKSRPQPGKSNPNYKDGKHIPSGLANTRHLTNKRIWWYSAKKPVYDIETPSHAFTAGVGTILAHNSIHVDFRYTLGEGRVSGATITVPFGLPNADEFDKKIEAAARTTLGGDDYKWKTVSRGDKLKIRDKLQRELSGEFFTEPVIKRFRPDFLDWNRKHVFIPKAMQDESWFKQKFTVIPPGFIGATVSEWAALCPFDGGEIEFGVIKSDYVEVFIYSDTGYYNGKLSLLFLPREQVKASLPQADDEGRLGREMWVGFICTAKNQLPYMLSPRAVEEDYLPEAGASSLPMVIRKHLPENCQYWKGQDRKEKRDSAVEWARKNLQAYTRKSVEDVPRKDELWQF